MKRLFASVSMIAAALTLAVAPVSPASAHEFRHHGHGGVPIIGGLVAAGVAIGGAAVAIATAPVRVVADAVTKPYPASYQPAPVYYSAPAPQPVYAYPSYGPAYGYAPYPAPVVYQRPVYVYRY